MVKQLILEQEHVTSSAYSTMERKNKLNTRKEKNKRNSEGDEPEMIVYNFR